MSTKLYQGELTIIAFLVIFENMTSKCENIGPIVLSFNPFPSLPSTATDDRKRFKCRNNKTRPFFLEFS